MITCRRRPEGAASTRTRVADGHPRICRILRTHIQRLKNQQKNDMSPDDVAWTLRLSIHKEIAKQRAYPGCMTLKTENSSEAKRHVSYISSINLPPPPCPIKSGTDGGDDVTYLKKRTLSVERKLEAVLWCRGFERDF